MNLENISKQQLFREITELMQPLYFPVPYEENNIQELAQQEYKLFCKVISARYGFDNDKYILAHNGHSLFDIVHDDVICELRSLCVEIPICFRAKSFGGILLHWFVRPLSELEDVLALAIRMWVSTIWNIVPQICMRMFLQ